MHGPIHINRENSNSMRVTSQQLAVETILVRVTNILIFFMHTYQDNIKRVFTRSDGKNVNSM